MSTRQKVSIQGSAYLNLNTAYGDIRAAIDASYERPTDAVLSCRMAIRQLESAIAKLTTKKRGRK